jgi:hypothetical protein
MALTIKAGVLKRNASDLSNQTKIQAQSFSVDKIENIRFGFLTPYSDSLGATSQVADVQVASVKPSPNSLVGADFYYVERDGTRSRYFIDASSTDVIAALDNTASETQFVALSSANGKTIVG